MKQAIGVVGGSLLVLVPKLGHAGTFAQWLQANESRMFFLYGICALLLVVIVLLMHRMRFFQNKLNSRTDELVQEQDQRVRAEVLLKQAHGTMETRVKRRTEELEKSNESLLESTNRMRQLVAFDELTALPNAAHFSNTVDTELSRALRETNPLSLLICRFDFYDNFVQSYGEDRSNAAIVKTSECVQDIFRRAGDSVARFTEDQFAVVFGADPESAMKFAERLQQAIWQIPIPHDSSEVADRVTVSIGVTTLLPRQLYKAEDAVTFAKMALKKAQKQGGNQIEHHSPEPAKKSTSEA